MGSLLVLLLMLGITIGIIFSNNDLETIGQTLASLHPGWVLAALGCWCLFILFDALSFWAYFRRHGHSISMAYACYVSLMGWFYSGITPGSSGGQPMQVFYLSKKKVPVGVSTSAVSIKFVLGQTATVVLVPVIWLMNRPFLSQQLAGVGWLVVIGWVVHLAGVLAVLLVTFCTPLVQRMAGYLVRMGVKLRLIRDEQAMLTRLQHCIDHYQTNVKLAGRSPAEIALQTLLAVLSLFFLQVIAVCIYHAFGLSGTSCWNLLAVAYMLYMGASYNPLPGASGAQEGGFLLFFRGIFPAGTISLAMLMWRFFTYYIQLILGAVALLWHTLRGRTKK